MKTKPPGTSQPEVLIVSFSVSLSDARVKRQAEALAGCFRVTVAGFGNAGFPRARFLKIKQSNERGKWFARRALEILEIGLCALRLYSLNYWLTKPEVRSLGRILKSRKFDVILANEPETIPVVMRMAPANTALVHDQHEYWPDLFISRVKRYALRGYRMWLMTKFARHLTHWSVVGGRIGYEYQQHVGMSEPVVISNASRFHELEPSTVNPERIELIHHGLWDLGRGIEKVIDALRLADQRFHLNLMLVNAPIDSLRKLASDIGVADRVHFHPAVPQDQVPTFINQCDVEVIFIQPVNKNFELALPNKLFEAIQGRLAIVSSPLPEVSDIVTKQQIGLTSGGFDSQSLATTLQSLSAETIRQMKMNTASAATEHCAEANEERLVELIQRALRNRKASKNRPWWN